MCDRFFHLFRNPASPVGAHPFLADARSISVRAQVDGRRWLPAAAGISMGLFALNRRNALLYGWRSHADGSRIMPAPPAGPRVQSMARRRQALSTLRLLVARANACATTQPPARPILISSHGGLNFSWAITPAPRTYQSIGYHAVHRRTGARPRRAAK